MIVSKFSVGVWIMCPEFVILCSLLTEGNKISQNQKNTRDTLFLHLYRTSTVDHRIKRGDYKLGGHSNMTQHPQN
jgi:hypothetical protein